MLLHLLLLCCAAPQAEAASAPVRPPAIPDASVPDRGIAGLDVAHYRLELAIDPERRFVEGIATLQLQYSSSQEAVVLDFHHMFEVVAARVNGRLCEAEQTPHRLRIPVSRSLAAGQTHEVEIMYRGLFPQEVWQGDVIGMIYDEVSLVAYLEPDGAHHWFPCNDHPSDKAGYELIIDAPDGQMVAAIGTLIAEEESPREGYHRSHWRTEIPTSSYLVALGVGPWVKIERQSSRVPIWDYCEERDHATIQTSLASVPAMMDFFESQFGPYPFEKYGHMLTRHAVGGMEDQSLTVLGREEALSGNQALLSHELAHQWFGNLVGPYQWCDLWLNEAWATWAELLWLEQVDLQAAAATRESWRRSTFRLSIREHPHSLAQPDPAHLFDGDLVYNKGGMVIDLLSGYLGREDFLAASRDYLAEYATGNARTADFQASLEKSTGADLEAFFAAWVRSNALPELKWEILAVEGLGRSTNGDAVGPWRVRCAVEQSNGHFPMNMALELQGAEKSQRHQVPLRFEQARVELVTVLPWRPLTLAPDPDKLTPWVPAEPRD